MFENILALSGRMPQRLVCVDGQLVNLLAVRRFVTPAADPVCLDVQFDLPFADGAFDAVFSSTCLPEIPAQAHVVREAVRVTAATGWTLFDSLWALDSGVLRCDPYRPYRYLQNFLPRAADYRTVIDRWTGDRSAGYAFSRDPGAQLSGPIWAFDEAEIEAELSAATDTELNALVIDRDRFAGFVPADHDWMPGALSVSPAYRSAPGAATLLRRRAEFAEMNAVFASLDFPGLPERVELDTPPAPGSWAGLFAAGVLAALPPDYDVARGPLPH
ncbi:methyltransferase domain-containing protein [Nocardia flavorosea]|uniref:Methyltransferase domain-containing protein n=2 Tax=Nocardia flavorosea TaxID=53429 RepID=A0A846YGP3_9NOCA|nr:methyltransferase domain-containing protein [Nocardia flavorosea]